MLTLTSKGQRGGISCFLKKFYQEDFLVDVGDIKCQVRCGVKF